MPPQRSPGFVVLMANLHPRATTSAVLTPQERSLNSGDWLRSTQLSIASSHRSIPTISTVHALSLHRKSLRNPNSESTQLQRQKILWRCGPQILKETSLLCFKLTLWLNPEQPKEDSIASTSDDSYWLMYACVWFNACVR